MKKVNLRGGGDSIDRVIANEHAVYARIYVDEVGVAWGLSIMIDNDVTQTKCFGYTNGVTTNTLSLGDSVHIVIDNVTKNMGTKYEDTKMKEVTTNRINRGYSLYAQYTWTSTVKPDDVKMELDCKVVDDSTNVIIAKCDSETTWGDSVFNRLFIYFGESSLSWVYNGPVNLVLFGTRSFPFKGSVSSSSWNESIRYDVSGHESNLTIGNQLTIMGLPESFVSHWVNTIHAEALMGTDRIMLVPPDSS